MNIKISSLRLFIATVLAVLMVSNSHVCRADISHRYTDITGTSAHPGLDDSGGSYTASPRGFEVPRRNPEIFDPSETQFGYDANGNTVKDQSRNIKTMCYNSINLPLSVQLVQGTDRLTGRKTSQSISYTYDAARVRHRVIHTTRIIIHNGYSSFETITYPFSNTRFLDK